MKKAATVCGAVLAVNLLCVPAYGVSVSPPDWWVNMADSRLQLMIRDKDLGKANVKTSYPGVHVDSVHRPSNADYIFVDLTLSDNVKPGVIPFEITKENGGRVSFSYELHERKKGSAQRQGYSGKDTIYLLTPDRFANGDESNDSLENYTDKLNREEAGGRHGGDIQGIIDHLDYLSDMGFTQIWSMPLLENAMDSYSYHGYAITDYYQIDPRYGSNDLYKTLSERAAEQGIGVIMDMVLNHIGSGHPWTTSPPDKDWIHHDGNFSATTHIRETLHDPHGAKADRLAFSDGWFVPSMPDLNQQNPFLANYLIQNAVWWVEYAGLSGIRVDTYSYSDKDFLSAWTARLMKEYPSLNIVGEEWSVNPVITSYWQSGTLRQDGYESSLPSVMDFPLQHTLVSALKEEESWGSGLKKLYELLAGDFIYGDAGNLVVFADNHDMSRIYTQLDQDMALWKMAMTVVLTTRGIPQVFYGTEILMDNAGTEDHGIIRSDFPGGWPGDESPAFSYESDSARSVEAQQFIRQLLHIRKQYPLLFEGQLTQYVPGDGTYVYFRHNRKTDTQIMVVINKNGKKDVNLQRFSERMAGVKTLQQAGDDEIMAAGNSLSVPEHSATVWILNQ
ncbi:cyclomaltodextrinase N-terminal domain-containing protein [Alteromonas sp. NFXS44]|uniref:glycoside hydrolase family 13 protein n=1 Tax=Alteromonas sp. NFXS44 TaxID=2818435 RepID=UPI0032DF251B